MRETGKSSPDLDLLVQICDALHTTPDRLLYPPEKRGRPGAEEIVDAALFQKIAIAIFVIGFALGISAGSGSYSPAPNTVGWHFVFSYALRYWGGAFLIGMIFVGIGKILSLLSALRETE